MRANKAREVLFFGSLAVSIVGHEVYDDDLVAQLERQNAFVKLHASASAPHTNARETFGTVATSSLYELHPADSPQPLSSGGGGGGGSGGHTAGGQLSSSHRLLQKRQHHKQRTAYLPVMLELAPGADVHDVPSPEASEHLLFGPSADGVTALNSDATVDNSAARDITAASLRIEVDLSRSGCRTGPVGIHDVLLPSLNYLAREDVCTVVRVPLLTSTIQKTAVQEVDAAVVARESAQLQSSGSLDGAAASAAAAGVAMNVYVVVRVVSLAEKVRLAVEAEDALRALLETPALPQDPPTTTSSSSSSVVPTKRVSVGLTLRGEAPYGVMPLTELYKHYKRFFETTGGGPSAAIKHSDAVMQRLTTAPRQREASASFPHRWSALTEMDLRPLLLGEHAAAPLLLTLAHCPNLRSLYADGNRLGDVSCARMAVLFSRHRYLAHLGLAKNGIHEAGGEQLVKLLKHNLRITSLPCNGNFFSETLRRRLTDMTQTNARVIAQDPLNVFSHAYGYLTDLSCLPESTQRQALRTWAMLCAAPVGDVDVMVRNLTTSSQRTIGDSPQVAMQRAKMALHARETFSLIPPAALAPLLNEIMRTVYVAVSRLLPDPLLRSLFTDMETMVVKQQEQKDAQSEDWNNPSSGNGNVLQNYSSGSNNNNNNNSLVGRSYNAAGNASSSSSSAATALQLPFEVQSALGGPYTPPINAEKLFARSFLRIVVTAFRGLSLGAPWEETAAVLEGIGRMHRDLGVMVEDYWLAVHVFMAAVRISCGSESYDADHASSFLAILALAVRTTAGFDVQLE